MSTWLPRVWTGAYRRGEASFSSDFPLCHSLQRDAVNNFQVGKCSERKENSVILGKGGQEDFIQAHCDRYQDHCNGILQWGVVREILSKKELMSTWKGRDQWMDN